MIGLCKNKIHEKKKKTTITAAALKYCIGIRQGNENESRLKFHNNSILVLSIENVLEHIALFI